MIVIDEQNLGAKDLQPQHQDLDTAEETAETAQLLPPPAYSSGSYGATYNAPLQNPQDVPFVPGERFPKGGNARKRFVKALIAACGVLLLIAALLASFVDFSILKGRNPPGNHSDNRIRTAQCIEGAEGVPTHPSEGSNNPSYSAIMGFNIPVKSDISFLGNDSYSGGQFIIDYVENSSSEIEVDVMVSYHTPKALLRAKVCLQGHGTERIFVIMDANQDSDPPSSANLLKYDIHVRLPVSVSNAGLLRVSQLETNFNLFAILVGDLGGRVQFDENSLVTGYNPIMVESLTAHKARIETAHAEISGNFTTTSYLEFSNKNAQINVDVSMQNAGKQAHTQTSLNMNNENSAIQARINLTNLIRKAGGNFSVNAATRNAIVLLEVLEQPVASFFDLSARSSSAATQVSLAPQFSGSFNLHSAVLRPILEVSQIPPEAGRLREVEVTKRQENILEGDVMWIDKRGRIERGGGLVDLRTNLLAYLLL